MDSNVTVNRAEMAKAAKHIEEHVGQINSIQNTLRGQIGNLMGRWEGNAAQAFNGAYQGFDSRFGEVKAELNKIYEKLTDTQLQYSNVEKANEESTRQITSALNF